MASLFISYARQDGRELALRLFNDLKHAGYEVWLDTSNISGGASWSREIEEAIERCDTELALLSAGSFRSEICRAEQLRALRKGKRVIPLMSERSVDRPLYLEHLNYRDFSDLTRFAESFQTLLVDLATNETKPLPESRRYTMVTAPPLPITFVPRPIEMETLRRAIIGDGGSRQIALTALRGMGGIGKSVLAAALCRDEIVQAAFHDGIVWVTIGREPKSLLPQMREIGKALGDDPTRYDTPEAGTNRLRTLLQSKAVLLILDDIWDASDVEAFRVDAPYCRMLFTTRDAGIALFIGAQDVRLGTLEPKQANALLREWAQRDDSRLGQMAERLGYLPLALKLAGSRLREGLSAEEWLKTFQHVSQIKFGRSSTDPKDNLQICFDLSRDRLPEADRALYDVLGIFPQDTPIPDTVVVRLWKRLTLLSDYDCGELLTEMARLELIERHPHKTTMMHDLIHDYMRGNLGDRWKHTHCELLSAYYPNAKSWWEVPDDGYIYAHLAWHLKEAERLEELKQLLSKFSWIKTKFESSDINAVIGDYDYLPQDTDLRTVQATLRHSAHILAGNPRELSGQLLGRLPGSLTQGIDSLRSQASEQKGVPWLRPLTQSLIPPDNSLIQTLLGHTSSVYAVAVTPDGRYVVSGSSDHTLRVWDLETGKTTKILQGHTSLVSAVAVTPDGRHVLSGSLDHTLRVWDFATGEIVKILHGDTSSVTALAVTPDGRYAISGFDNNTLHVWDLTTGKTTKILQGHTSLVSAVTVTPDGHYLVSGSHDRTLRAWDLATGETTKTLEGHTSLVSAVTVTSDGRYVVSGSWDNTLRVWDLSTGQTTKTLQGHTSLVSAVAVTPDGRRVLSGSRDNSLRVWDLITGGTERVLQGHTAWVSAVAVKPDGRYVVSGSWDKTLRVWDLATGETKRTLLGHTGSVTALAVRRDGRHVVSGSWDKTLRVWDLATGEIKGTLQREAGLVSAVAILLDGRYVVSGSHDSTLRVWDLATGKTRGTLQGHTGWVSAVAVTPDGRYVVSGSWDKTLRVWDLVTGETKRVLEGHTDSVTSLAVTPDGRHVVSGSHDRTLRVWDLTTGKTTKILQGHTSWVNAVAVTPDGRCVVSGSHDRTLRAWDLATVEARRTLQGHTSWVNAVAVTPDGRYVVSGSDDRTLRVWELKDGKQLVTFTVDGDVRACITAQENGIIVAGDGFGRLHFLRLEGVD